jgi:hypothetical protein
MVFSLVAIGCSGIAVMLLWMAWRGARHAGGLLALSLVAWASALLSWTRGFGVEVGIPLTLEAAAIVALGFILSRIEFRPARVVRERTAPPLPRPRHRWLRGTMRAVGAGPIAFAASAGIGVLFATAAPFADATRLIVAGLLIPSLWGATMTWVLASRRLLIPPAGLLSLAAMTFAASMLVTR